MAFETASWQGQNTKSNVCVKQTVRCRSTTANDSCRVSGILLARRMYTKPEISLWSVHLSVSHGPRRAIRLAQACQIARIQRCMPDWGLPVPLSFVLRHVTSSNFPTQDRRERPRQRAPAVRQERSDARHKSRRFFRSKRSLAEAQATAPVFPGANIHVVLPSPSKRIEKDVKEKWSRNRS